MAAVSRNLQDNLHRKFAVFSVEDFLEWFDSLERELSDPPKVSIAREPNPGAVMDVSPEGSVPGSLPARPTDSEAWTSSDFAVPRVRGVWKNDLLRDGRRDPHEARRDVGRAVQGDGRRVSRRLDGPRDPNPERHCGEGQGPGARRRIEPGSDSGIGGLACAQQGSTKPRRVHAAAIGRAPRPDLRAIGALVDAYDAGASAIHLVVQARRIAEVLARETCRAHGLDVAGRQFVDLCRDIAGRSLLTDKQQTDPHTLRKLGNFAAARSTGR